MATLQEVQALREREARLCRAVDAADAYVDELLRALKGWTSDLATVGAAYRDAHDALAANQARTFPYCFCAEIPGRHTHPWPVETLHIDGCSLTDTHMGPCDV